MGTPKSKQRRARKRGSAPGVGIDDPFAILGVAHDVTFDEARSAYLALVAKYHPDKVAHLAEEFQELAERRTREINGAFAEIERILTAASR
jgi:preprotein translocase subunit Sec63